MEIEKEPTYYDSETRALILGTHILKNCDAACLITYVIVRENFVSWCSDHYLACCDRVCFSVQEFEFCDVRDS